MGRINWHGQAAKEQPRSPLCVHVGKQLLKMRQKKQVSLRALHQATGLSTAFLCTIENGKVNPSAESLWKMSQFFGVAVGYWFKGYSDPN